MSTVKRVAIAVALLGFLGTGLSACKSANPAHETAKAVAAAQNWLAMIDAGKYADAWQNSDDAIKSVGSKEQFATMMGRTRAPLGKVQSRAVQQKAYAKDPQNAPPGEYVQVHFNTAFENAKSAIELVTLKKQSDGSWKVGQYSVNPE
ncbi:MAG TPA: DUF4019 domain-containing protein [Candidatus Binataceae bacterium]|nr:DUF4019 domain-containing protein [Candidatus Binataceae bacterium]